jgi:hypothetical protein
VPLGRSSAGDGGRDGLAAGVDLGRLGRPRLRVHRPERFEKGGDLARLAERGDARGFQLRQRAGGGDAVEKGVGHGLACSLAAAQNAKACYSRRR